MFSNNLGVFLLGKDNKGWSIDKDRIHAKNFLNRIDGVKLLENKYEILFADIVHCVWYNFLINAKVYYLLYLLKYLTNLKVSAVITNQIDLYEDRFDRLSGLVDIWVYPNKYIKDFLDKKGVESVYIPFYVDRQVFTENSKYNRESVCDYFDLDYDKLKDKFLIGSFQRDSLGEDLSQPKWQKNPDLLLEIVRQLPSDRVELILAGPRRHYIINKAEKLGLSYTFVGNESYIRKNQDDFETENNLSSEDLARLYNIIDLYLITSESETGPKSVLESSLCGALTMSTDVGMSSEVFHNELIYSSDNPEEAVSFIKNIIESNAEINEYLDYNRKHVKKLIDDNKMKERYNSIIQNLKQ
ncbi:MAG: glycosyltransferase [Candidatus Paceibacteria bacterium]